MKKILIFNAALLFSIALLKAQTNEDDQADVYENMYATSLGDAMSNNPLAANTDPMIIIDTLMPVRKSFIRRANIIFRDRDRLKYENMRLRSEIADLNKDITQKSKQIKELTDYVNNQAFALNDAKKTAKQAQEDVANIESDIERLNEDLNKANRAKVWWTVGGVLVGVGIGGLVGYLLFN